MTVVNNGFDLSTIRDTIMATKQAMVTAYNKTRSEKPGSGAYWSAVNQYRQAQEDLKVQENSFNAIKSVFG